MGLFDKLFRKSLVPPSPAGAEGDFVVDLAKVVPRIKGVFGNATPDPIPHQNPESEHLQMTFADSPIYETFATDLGVFYAVDMGDRYVMLQNRHLSETITREKLHEAALHNLAKEVGERTELSGDPTNLVMLTNGGNFEAAMLLADWLWENVTPLFKDEICVAVPARDLLFIAGKNNLVGRDSLRAIVRKFFDEQETQGLLVRHIYTREGNRWVVVETA
jgi:hypothetical protein